MIRSKPLSFALVAAFAFAAPLLLGALDLPSPADLEMTLTTDRRAYEPGEPIEIEVNRCNPTDQSIQTTQACPCCGIDLEILDASGEVVATAEQGCVQSFSGDRWEPGECTVEPYRWMQSSGLFPRFETSSDGPRVPPGEYTLHYTWEPFGHRDEVETTIRIVPIPAVPTLSELSLAALALALVGAGLVALRRA